MLHHDAGDLRQAPAHAQGTRDAREQDFPPILAVDSFQLIVKGLRHPRDRGVS